MSIDARRRSGAHRAGGHSTIRAARTHIAVATACSLLISPLAATSTAAHAGQPQGEALAKAPGGPAAARPKDLDGGWPRVFNTPGGSLFILYQPQVVSWTDQKHAVLLVAVSYTAKGAPKASLGTITLEADTSVAVAERLVSFSDFRITKPTFTTLPAEQARSIADEITANVPRDQRVIALDRVLAYVDKSRIVPKNVDGLKADPPAIFHSATSALLVNLDGDPIWSPIKDNDLKFAVNTNWDLFQHAPTGTLYLRHDHSWLQATTIAGPWKAAGTLPASFSKLPPDDNWKDVKAAVPGVPSSVPKVFVSTRPAELILVTGAPSYLVVTGTKLLWVSNSESDVFRLGKGGPLYFLVSGRWFSAPDFSGPWTFATPSLPDDFKKIPVAHPRSRVLASVPGTEQANEAVLLAQIPETARVDKKQVKAPDVAYQGEAQFQPIERTTVARATNTDKDIIKVGDLYYMCFQGVWFMAKAPGGPWEVTGVVPQQIYEIPPSSPSYNVTQVTIVEDNSDAAVYATAAAYTGMMVAWGCVVWGTGYYYPPYVGYGGFYPAYYPYYPSYGYHASYNPWTGAYSRGAVAYGPYGGAGIGARYNPRTGTYARGAAAYGPYGARGAGQAYNPRTGAYGATRQGSSVYGSWGQTGVQRGNQWATTSRVTNNATGATTRRTQTSGGGTAVTRNGAGAGNNSGVARTGSGDVYAGRDGNVYRNQGGSWQKYDSGGGWNSVQQPTPQQREQAQQRATQARDSAAASPTVGQLNSDSAARSEGAQRTRDASSVNSGARNANAGSYRPSGGTRSGGGMPAGGGRRR
ncbi:MAG: hypothetical protein DMF93_17165 [Acidobacteria bacterium]|nr:MAG: hypothetical protein DMF93_17165 [Acidobacteriota bacterium]